MVHACGIWEIFPFYHNLSLLFMFLYLSFIYHFYHGMFYAHCYFLIFIKDLPFSSFLLIIFNICKNLLFFDYKKSSVYKRRSCCWNITWLDNISCHIIFNLVHVIYYFYLTKINLSFYSIPHPNQVYDK